MGIEAGQVVVFDENLIGTAAFLNFLKIKSNSIIKLIAAPPMCSVETVEYIHRQIVECKNVCAIGGGAIIDTVKLAMLPDWSALSRSIEVGRSGFVALRGSNANYKWNGRIEAVPTTIGTGAEASSVALVVNRAGRRRLIMGHALKPYANYCPQFYDTLSTALIYEGAVEIALRIIGEYVSSKKGEEQVDELALGMLQELQEAMGAREKSKRECCSRLAYVSAFSHSACAVKGRGPFTWPLWYIANELSAVCSCRKMEASLPLIPLMIERARNGGLPWGMPGRVSELESKIGNLERIFSELYPLDVCRVHVIDSVVSQTASQTVSAWGGMGMPLAGVSKAEIRALLCQLNDDSG